MPFIPATNVAKVIITAKMNDTGDVLNILHFVKPTAITTADLAALALAVKNAWAAQIMPLVSNQQSLMQVTAIDLTSISGPEATSVASPPVVGGQGGTALPSDTSIVLTKRTAKRGRSYRGRCYIGGLTVGTQVSEGQISLAGLGNFITALTNVLTAPGVAPFIWGVLSLISGKTPRPVGLLEPGLAITGDTSYDSQRRRLKLRGQ